MRLGARLVAAAACAAMLTPATAAAGSLVFVRDFNVWLANTDGSGQVQLTANGSSSTRYESPSQADDGTIVVRHGNKAIRMDRSGNVLNTVLDYNFTSRTGPLDPAVSPDGKIVAHNYLTPSSVCTGCFSTYLDYEWADGSGVAGDGAGSSGDPSWISNSQVVVSAGATIQTDTTAEFGLQHWFGYNDADHVFDPDVAADKLVLIKGGSQTEMRVLTLNGPPPELPTGRCFIGLPAGRFDDPTLAPDGGALAWAEDDGIWTSSLANVGAGDCGTPIRIIEGGDEPDWGPADVAAAPPTGAPTPTPTPTPPPSPAGSPSGGGTGATGGGAAAGAAPDKTAPTATLAVKAPRLRVALGSGIPVALTCSETCAAVVQLLLDTRAAKKLGIKAAATVTVGSKTASLPAGVKKTVVVKLAAKAKRKLRRARKVVLTVRAITTDAAGNASASSRRITLKR